jgi:hypothetical protein
MTGRQMIPMPADVLDCPADSYAMVAWAKLVHSRFAAYIAARYNGPVFLVGSALRVPNPRDIDVRVVIADAEFDGRYGRGATIAWRKGEPIPQPWIDDMAKRNGELARLHRMNADFQVYPAGACIQYHKQPRVVLAAPSNLDHIDACTAWFYAEPATDPTTVPITGFDGEDGG